MSAQQPTWARHFQNTWHERAGHPHLPAWLRVAALAYGSHRANGHATFGRGDVGLVLGRVDPSTGEVMPTTRQDVHRAVVKAVEYGWLAAGSTARCLIVPAHAISGGLGRPDDQCPQHSSSGTGKRGATARRLRAVGAAS